VLPAVKFLRVCCMYVCTCTGYAQNLFFYVCIDVNKCVCMDVASEKYPRTGSSRDIETTEMTQPACL